MSYNVIQFYEHDGWRVTSGYGSRVHPVTKAQSFHHGIDFGGKPAGAGVKTPYGGKVVSAEFYPGRGNTVTILIAPGILQLNQHLDAFRCKKGDTVKAGDIIGLNGSSGDVTGPHIHYELRNNTASGRPIGGTVWGNPANYFGDVILRRGSRGPDVVELQTWLMSLGYDLPAFGADGSFGPETETAVMALQTDNGLIVSGVVGRATMAIIATLSASKEQPPAPPQDDTKDKRIAELEKELATAQGELSTALTKINNMEKDFSAIVKLGKKHG